MNTTSISNRIAVSILTLTVVFTVTSGQAAQENDQMAQQTVNHLLGVGHCADVVESGLEAADRLASGNVATMAKLCKPIGFVAGAAQGVAGAKELSEGHVGSGSVEMVGATAKTTADIAEVAGLAGLCKLAGGVGAGIDGAIDIYHGVQSDQPEKTAVGSVKCTVSAMLMASAAQPELAEVLVPAAALTYVGAIATDAAYDHQEEICDVVNTASAEASQYMSSARSSVANAASDMADRTQDVLDNVRDSASSNLASAASTVRERSQQLKNWWFN